MLACCERWRISNQARKLVLRLLYHACCILHSLAGLLPIENLTQLTRTVSYLQTDILWRQPRPRQHVKPVRLAPILHLPVEAMPYYITVACRQPSSTLVLYHGGL